MAQKSYCLLALNRKEEALTLTKHIAEVSKNNPLLLDTVGNLFSLNKNQKAALAAFEQASALDPNNAHYAVNLALIQQSLGDFQGAETAFDRAIALKSVDYEIYLHRAKLRKQTRDKNHIRELENLLTTGVKSWRGKVILHYALAKEYEDINAHERSFEHLRLGADLRRSHMQYNIQKDLNIIDKIIECFSFDFFRQKWEGYDSHEPIFIIGLPRTGTTLVERIINTNSSVYAAGELNNFASQLVDQINEHSEEKSLSSEALVEASMRVDFARLGDAYIESTRPHTGHTAYFIDKLPLNYLYCGLINLALPNAKIIHLNRHPMDTCYAIYKTYFIQTYPFSYDLQELGQYYIAYHKLMDHWHKVIPNKIFDVQYEDMVNDQEGVSRRLFDYCGLEWDESCLDFHKNEAPSMTASLAQIRQPVYTSSIGNWCAYEQQLDPLKRLLKQANILAE